MKFFIIKVNTHKPQNDSIHWIFQIKCHATAKIGLLILFDSANIFTLWSAINRYIALFFSVSDQNRKRSQQPTKRKHYTQNLMCSKFFERLVSFIIHITISHTLNSNTYRPIQPKSLFRDDHFVWSIHNFLGYFTTIFSILFCIWFEIECKEQSKESESHRQYIY